MVETESEFEPETAVEEMRVRLREVRRVRFELTKRLNETIATTLQDDIRLRQPVFTAEHKREIVIGLLEAAIVWCADGQFEANLSEARRRLAQEPHCATRSSSASRPAVLQEPRRPTSTQRRDLPAAGAVRGALNTQPPAPTNVPQRGASR